MSDRRCRSVNLNVPVDGGMRGREIGEPLQHLNTPVVTTKTDAIC